MSLRLLRVCELIKRELGSIIGREMRFSAPLVSVRAVDITPDLRQAHVFISAIGTKRQKEEAIAELSAKRQHLQHELSRRVILKYTPHLHFELDESIERGTRVLSLLDELGPLPEETDPEGHHLPGDELAGGENGPGDGEEAR
jgi:ribosome-binding factor A